MHEGPSALLAHLARATTRIRVVGQPLPGLDAVLPAEYEITDEGALAELLALLAVDEDATPFCCMCHGDMDLLLYDSAGRCVQEFQLHRPSGLGCRDREGQLPLLRAPELVRLLDPAHPEGLAARLLHGLAPARLLAALAQAEISQAILTPYAPTSELHGAVAYFTSRHPKKRRLATPARTLLIEFARGFHPDQVKLFERRVLQTR
ncbi:hypothetical protein ABZ746_22855 [Streptomyces sp. NPDC020096]